MRKEQEHTTVTDVVKIILLGVILFAGFKLFGWVFVLIMATLMYFGLV